MIVQVTLFFFFLLLVAYVEGREEGGDRGNSQQPLTQVIISVNFEIA